MSGVAAVIKQARRARGDDLRWLIATATTAASDAAYDLAKTPSNGRWDGVFERKSLTNPSFVLISTCPAALLAP
jgi:hypothetical protein